MKKSLFVALAAVVLAMPSMAQEEEEVWRYTRGWVPTSVYSPSGDDMENVKAGPTPQNLSEAVAKMPAVPSIEQIYCIEAKEKALRTPYAPYHKSLYAALEQNAKVSQDLDRRIQAAGKKQQASNQQAMAQYQSNVNAGLMPSQEEMMALYMSGAITEDMSEEQMMDVMAGKFAAKWGVSKQEYLKIINMAQSNPKGTEAYLKSNHPDLYNRLYAANAKYGNQNVNVGDQHENEYGELGEKLSDLANEAFEFKNKNMDMMKHMDHKAHINSADLLHMGVGEALGLPTNELEDLYAQIIDGWPASAECKRAFQTEESIAERIDNWDCCKNAKDGQTSCNPAWWIEGRKSENALIDAWNRKQAEKWLAEVKAYDAQMTAMVKRLIELDNQLEQIRNGGEITAAYAAAKNQAYIAATYLYDFNFVLEVALQFPHVARQEESHCWTFFIKG